MKKLKTMAFLFALTSILAGDLIACEVEVAEQGRETLKKYVETITSKEQDRGPFAKAIAETLLTAASCDSLPLPVLLNERRGYYQGILIIFQFSGVENFASRPSLKAVDESHNRLVKAQEAVKK